MIDSSCPHCDQYLELEYCKLGSFMICPLCDEKFKVRAMSGSKVSPDIDYDIEYKKFLDLIVEELHFLNSILTEKLKVCIHYRWKDNDLLQYYAFKLYHPEEGFEIPEVFEMIVSNKEIRNQIYNKWMDNHR